MVIPFHVLGWSHILKLKKFITGLFGLDTSSTARLSRRLSPEENAMLAWSRLVERDFSGVFSSDKSLVQLCVCVPNIEEHVLYLQRLNHCLRTDQPIPAGLIKTKTTSVYQRDYFVTLKGDFSDPNEQMRALSAEACELLQQYEEKSCSLNRSFITDKNLALARYAVSCLILLHEEFT